MMSILAGKANSFIAEIAFLADGAFSGLRRDCRFCSKKVFNVKRNTPSGAELVRKKFGPSLASFGKIQFSSVHPEEKEEEEVGWIERMCRLKALEGWFGGNGKQEKAGSESSNPIGLPGLIGKNRFQSFLHPLRRDQPKRDKERKLSWRVSGVW
ncbi:hypothetical protein TNCV_2516491 [Trichonephila clavipes]|nr:hypothetical protein TNCV_2516491 [Trichonephila clavipes]